MKATIKVEKEVDIIYCQVKAEVRYWEDTEVDGVEDENGNLIPCREGNLWCPLINIETGVIVNWKQGKKAKIHYKVCDAGSYYLQDENGETVLSIEDNYVPNSLIPGDYGDYIVMTVNEDGVIKEWKSSPDISDFLEEENF